MPVPVPVPLPEVRDVERLTGVPPEGVASVPDVSLTEGAPVGRVFPPDVRGVEAPPGPPPGRTAPAASGRGAARCIGPSPLPPESVGTPPVARFRTAALRAAPGLVRRPPSWPLPVGGTAGPLLVGGTAGEPTVGGMAGPAAPVDDADGLSAVPGGSGADVASGGRPPGRPDGRPGTGSARRRTIGGTARAVVRDFGPDDGRTGVGATGGAAASMDDRAGTAGEPGPVVADRAGPGAASGAGAGTTDTIGADPAPPVSGDPADAEDGDDAGPLAPARWTEGVRPGVPPTPARGDEVAAVGPPVRTGTDSGPPSVAELPGARVAELPGARVAELPGARVAIAPARAVPMGRAVLAARVVLAVCAAPAVRDPLRPAAKGTAVSRGPPRVRGNPGAASRCPGASGALCGSARRGTASARCTGCA
ncbi:hypothetical protein ACWF94_17590 [Streptomyces sp. NPDC055078]